VSDILKLFSGDLWLHTKGHPYTKIVLGVLDRKNQNPAKKWHNKRKVPAQISFTIIAV